MTVPPNIDPFNLVSLSDEINDRCLRIMASDFPAVVNEESLNKLKEKFKDETISLFTEMLNDWQNLRDRTNLPDLMGNDWIIPTVEMMVQQFPRSLSVRMWAWEPSTSTLRTRTPLLRR